MMLYPYVRHNAYIGDSHAYVSQFPARGGSWGGRYLCLS
jgi:hypothetical protein